MKYANEGFPKYVRWFGIVLSLAPMAGGIGLICSLIRDVDRTQQAQDWVQVEAWVKEASLETQVSPKGLRSYELRCRYHYSYLDQEFDGHQITLLEDTINIGHRQKRILEKLRTAKEKREAIPCYVNPNDPEDAVLFRELEVPVIAFWFWLGLSLIGVGLTICLLMIREIRRAERTQELQIRFPEQPWQWKDCWQQNIVTPLGRDVSALVWAVGVYFTLVGIPFATLTWPEVLEHGGGWEVYLFGTAAILTGPVILIVATYLAINRRRFKDTHLRLEMAPAGPGQSFYSDVVIRPARRFLGPMQGTLICSRIQAKGRYRNKTTYFRRDYELEVAEPPQDDQEILLPFRLDVPAGFPPTDESDPMDQIIWTLELKAKTEAGAFRLSFLMPVFQIDEYEEA